MRHALCQVLKHGNEQSDCESSCPCYYSQIEGLGLHVVYITRYVIRIKKHLHNRIEIKSKSNRTTRNMNLTGRLANYPPVYRHKIVQTLGLNLFKNSPFYGCVLSVYVPLNSTQADDDNLMLQTFLLFMSTCVLFLDCMANLWSESFLLKTAQLITKQGLSTARALSKKLQGPSKFVCVSYVCTVSV